MIECKDMSFSYDNSPLLHKVNLQWKSSELNMLLGRNGAGKSTFLRLLANLLDPSQGEITWNKSRKVDFNQLIASIESPHLPSSISARRFLHENLSWYDRARLDDIDSELEMWGVPTRKKMGELSQGNLQKVQILRCLLSGCPYVIFDEPTAHLDPVQVHYFWSKIREYQSAGTSFFVSSHHLSEMFVPRSKVYLLHGASIDEVEPDKPWRWRVLWKDLKKDHYCDEDFFEGTMEACNEYIALEIQKGRQLLQMVAADWEVGEEDRGRL